MREIPPCEPIEFVAGDTVSWTKSLRDYLPSDGWTLKYRIVGAAAVIEPTAIAATANDAGGWEVTILAAASTLAPGVARLIGWVEDAGAVNRYTIIDRPITVLANYATGSAASLLTTNETILAAIDARIAGRVTADQESVQVNGTALTRIPIEQLQTLRGHYAAAVWRERNPDVSTPQHRMRFR